MIKVGVGEDATKEVSGGREQWAIGRTLAFTLRWSSGVALSGWCFKKNSVCCVENRLERGKKGWRGAKGRGAKAGGLRPVIEDCNGILEEI